MTEQHPGGAGAVLGIRLLRYSGVQGTSLLIGNVLQMVSVVVVAAYLGPDEMGRFALLLFLAGLVTQVLSVACKPGTIMRTFGGGDDEGDEDDRSDVAASPQRALGTGLVWAAFLGIVGAITIVVWRDPIAEILLGDSGEGQLVLWTGVLAGAWVIYKLAAIVLWLERRPSAFIVADTSRPTLGLIAVTVLLATGSGLEGAIIGTTIGTAVAAVVAVFLLRGSFEATFDLGELKQILIRGGYRAPIVISFWAIQGGDIFLLSRFVDHTDLGIYNLASRLGFIVSFLPQGFRISMRPLRKGVAFQAMREQYGRAVAQGQLLGYFTLVCVFAVLAMVLGGAVLVGVAPDSYSAAAGLIPFTAAGFVMPALYRTVNQTTSVPAQRLSFVLGCVIGALLFAATIIALAPVIGAYAAPIGMLIGLGLPAAFLFVRGQLGGKPLRFPYRAVLTSLALAAAIGGGFQLLPSLPGLVELAIAFVLLAVYVALLIVFRVVPERHWAPLLHTLRSTARGTPVALNPRAGLRVLDPGEREELRLAVIRGLPADRLAPPGDGRGEGERLVLLLRRVANQAGVKVDEPTERDREISVFLFEDAPAAVHDQSMDRLLDAGAAAADLRALEDLVRHLARIPDDAWEGRRAGRRRRLAAGSRRRRATRSA